MFEKEVQAKGLEGLVARAEDGRSYKIKPTKELDAAILGFTERRDADGALMIRSLLFGVMQEDGSWIPLIADLFMQRRSLLQLVIRRQPGHALYRQKTANKRLHE